MLLQVSKLNIVINTTAIVFCIWCKTITEIIKQNQ